MHQPTKTTLLFRTDQRRFDYEGEITFYKSLGFRKIDYATSKKDLDQAPFPKLVIEKPFFHKRDLRALLRYDHSEAYALEGTGSLKNIGLRFLASREAEACAPTQVPLGGRSLSLTDKRAFEGELYFRSSFWEQINPQRALFLDRDGVLIEDCGYPHRVEDLKIRKSIVPLLKKVQERGYKLIIVTNQSGLAREIFNLRQFQLFSRALFDSFEKHYGIHFQAQYFCPFHGAGTHPRFGGRESVFRKPSPGMVLKAQGDFYIDLSKSFMVGDKWTDRLDGIRLRTLFTVPMSQL